MRLADLRTTPQERQKILEFFDGLWIGIGPNHDLGTLEGLHRPAARVLGLWLDRSIATMLTGKADEAAITQSLAELNDLYQTLRKEAQTTEDQHRISAVMLLALASFRAWRYTADFLHQPWGSSRGDGGPFDRLPPAERTWLKWTTERRDTTTRTGKIRRTGRPHAQSQWLREALTDLRAWTVDEIRPQDIDRVLRGTSDPKRRKRAVAVLRDFFDWCEAHGHIDRSPIRKEA